MRVEIVTDTFAPDVNGVAMTLGRLSKLLKDQGHYVHVIHTSKTDKKGETYVEGVAFPGYPEVKIGLPQSIKLRARWEKKCPDVIYVATESPLGISAIRVARSLGIPSASGFHTNFQQYMDKYKLDQLQPIAMGYLKRVHDQANCTLVPSPDIAEELRSAGFKEVYLMGRGVDTQLFTPKHRRTKLRESWGANDHDPVVMIVGRVAPEKNLDLGIRAFEAMREKAPNLQAVIVGDGPIKNKLSGQHPDIHFAGNQSGKELARYYASADFLLFPSETETFGNVLLEGMASGLVTLSYNYAASAQHVTHGINGFNIEKGNEQAYIQQAIDLLDINDTSLIKLQALETAAKLSWEAVGKVFEKRLAALVHEKPAHLRRIKKPVTVHFKSLFLSDIHLGTEESKTNELIDLLKRSTCDRIYLNGDIIDVWALKQGQKWTSRHTRVIRVLLKKMEKENTQIIYLRGNHDDILTKFLPISLENLSIQKEHIHETPSGKRYLVVHGDGFDSVTTRWPWLAKVGGIGYNGLLKLNRYVNRYRAWQGKPPSSLSKDIKAKIKETISFVDHYQDQLQQYAHRRNLDGIICGHIHTPEDKYYGDVHYMNSGDWVETMSFIAEHENGKLQVIKYSEFCERLEKLS